MKPVALLLLCLALIACQAPNPYTAASRSLPPAPAEINVMPDPSSYPAPPRDYAAYRSWAWQGGQLPAGSPWASAEQVQQALSEALDQRGLRPARDGVAADLLARVELNLERRIRQVVDRYDEFHSPGYPADYPGHWGRAPLVHAYEIEVLVLRLELFDGRDNQLVWQGQAQLPSGGDQAQRARALRDALKQALASYPPE